MTKEKTNQPFGDPISEPFWEGARQHRLLIQCCQDCSSFQFYPRPFCILCDSDRVDWVESKGVGTVYSLTTVVRKILPDFEIPYMVAIVELNEGPRLLSSVVSDSCDIGDPVRVAWREREGKPPLPVFEKEDSSGKA